MGHQQKEEETGRAKGLGRGSREETVKWNQRTVLRFRTGWRHETSPASPSGRGLQRLQLTGASIALNAAALNFPRAPSAGKQKESWLKETLAGNIILQL